MPAGGTASTIEQVRWLSSLLPTVVCSAVLAMGAGVAMGATGDLAYEGCISSQTAHPACAERAGATADGENSGLANPSDVVVSPDGSSVYATSSADDAISHFQRNPGSGALTYVGCISGEQATTACTAIASATPDGAGSGLNGLDALVISPDGSSIHAVAGGDDAVATFTRSPMGALSYVGCVSGDQDVAACTRIPGAVSGGLNTGLSNPDSVAISPGGGEVYAGQPGDGAVAVLSRVPATGLLAYVGCISGDSDTPCEKIPGAVSGAGDTGLSSLRDIVVRPDGGSLYAVSDSDESVAEFSRDPSDGSLDWRRCISGATSITNCDPIPGATAIGNGTGMRSIVAVDVSADGKSLFTAADSDNAVAFFDLTAAGAASFAGCFSGDTNATNCTAIPGAAAGATNSGLDFTSELAATADNRSVYALGTSDDAVVVFSRDPQSGALGYVRCLSMETTSTACTQLPGAAASGLKTGLDEPRGIFVSADGRSLYAVTTGDDSIAHFLREEFVPPPAPPPDTAAPGLEIEGRRVQRSPRRIVARLRADENAVADLLAVIRVKETKRKGGTGTAAGAKVERFRIRLKDIALASGERQRVTIKLKKRQRRAVKDALSGQGKVRAKLSATATDQAGNQSERAKLKIQLEQKKKKKRVLRPA